MNQDGISGGEEALIQARRSKADRLRERGQRPFANDVRSGDRVTVRQLRIQFESALLDVEALRYDAERVSALASTEACHVLGRLMARRDFGKASFLRLRDASGEIQLWAKRDLMGEYFSALEDIDVGDHVEAHGRCVVTKTGELTLELGNLRLLTKALRPLPDKWHGLTDIDQRYRRRYVDLVANPEVQVVLRARALIVQALRGFLDARAFLEVETPTLHSLVGGAAARPFTTHHNALDLELFLRIAPELYLKRLLVGGFERVYELGRCYRNEGTSTRHNPEFTILELYQAYADYQDLMLLAEQMLRHVDCHLCQGLERLGLGRHYAQWEAARPFTLTEPFVQIPLAQATTQAIRCAGIPAEGLNKIWEMTSQGLGGETVVGQALGPAFESVRRSPRYGRIEWANWSRALGRCDSDGERVFATYEYLAEPFLAEDYRSRDGVQSVPVFILDYPAELSPLARRKDSDDKLTDRFELFIESRELCNAFSELNDPDDQADRFRVQLEKKQRGNAETMDYDADYIRALEHGMPPAAGFGLGVDRLVMTLCSQASIRDVISFPLLRPESG
ncbi:lysine--tRNA ligase [Myxococcota bacterium]